MGLFFWANDPGVGGWGEGGGGSGKFDNYIKRERRACYLDNIISVVQKKLPYC